MSQYLASDDANPEFVGAHNPDSRLSCRFFVMPVQNNFKSEMEGRPIFDDLEMVEIHVPGDKLNVVVAPTREEHKRRFPLQWAHYSAKKEGDQRLAGKTPITAWVQLTPAQAEELRWLKFLSVEDVANASDTALQSLKMIGGMTPYKLREAAQNYLAAAAGKAVSQRDQEAIASLRAENDTLRAQMQTQAASFEDRFAQLAAKINAAPAPAVDIPMDVEQEPTPRKAKA